MPRRAGAEEAAAGEAVVAAEAAVAQEMSPYRSAAEEALLPSVMALSPRASSQQATQGAGRWPSHTHSELQ